MTRALLWLEIIFFIAPPIMRGAGEGFSEYLNEVWRTEDGLPENTITAIWNTYGSNFRPGFMARVTYPPTPGEGRTMGSRDGSVWIVNQQVQKFRDGRWVRTMIPPEPINSIGSLGEDRHGNFWVGTWEQGLFRFSPTGEFRQFKLSDSPTHWPVRQIFEDREGNLWIGSGGDGLWRFKPRAVTTYDGGSGMKSEVVRSVAEDQEGKIWICNLGGIDWFSPEMPKRAKASNLTIPIPWSLLTDRRGVVWITTYESGLFSYDHGKLTRFVEDPPPPFNRPALNGTQRGV